MKWTTGFLLAGALAALPVAVGGDQPSRRSLSGNPDRGMAIFNAYCIGCHGDEGKGDGPLAPRLLRDFQVVPIDLSNPAWQNSHSDGELKKAIRHGRNGIHATKFMPAWGLTLTEGQVDDLVVFVRDLANPARERNPRVSTLDIQQQLELGRTLYSVYCLACHGRQGGGDGPLVESARQQGILNRRPPDFRDGFMDNKTDAELRAMAASSPGHAHLDLEAEDTAWWHRPLSDQEAAALAFFLRAQAVAHRTKSVK